MYQLTVFNSKQTVSININIRTHICRMCEILVIDVITTKFCEKCILTKRTNNKRVTYVTVSSWKMFLFLIFCKM